MASRPPGKKPSGKSSTQPTGAKKSRGRTSRVGPPAPIKPLQMAGILAQIIAGIDPETKRRTLEHCGTWAIRMYYHHRVGPLREKYSGASKLLAFPGFVSPEPFVILDAGAGIPVVVRTNSPNATNVLRLHSVVGMGDPPQVGNDFTIPSNAWVEVESGVWEYTNSNFMPNTTQSMSCYILVMLSGSPLTEVDRVDFGTNM